MEGGLVNHNVNPNVNPYVNLHVKAFLIGQVRANAQMRTDRSTG